MGSSGSPGKIDSLNFAPQLEAIARQMQSRGGTTFHRAFPLYQQLASQAGEALATGRVQAQTPQVQQAVEGIKLGAADQTQQARDQLGLGHLTGTPYGQSQLADISAQANQQIGQAPIATALQTIMGAPGTTQAGFGSSLGFGQGAGGTLGQVQGLDLARQQQNAEGFQALMETIRDSIKALAAGASGGMGGGQGIGTSMDSQNVNYASLFGGGGGTASPGTVTIPNYGGGY